MDYGVICSETYERFCVSEIAEIPLPLIEDYIKPMMIIRKDYQKDYNQFDKLNGSYAH